MAYFKFQVFLYTIERKTGNNERHTDFYQDEANVQTEGLVYSPTFITKEQLWAVKTKNHKITTTFECKLLLF